jgi:hypothetical protein
LEIFLKSSGRSFHKTAAAYLKLKLSPSCLHDLVVFKDCKYNFRYFNIVDIPRVRTSTYGKNSFKYAAAAKMPRQRTKIKIRQNESMKNC